MDLAPAAEGLFSFGAAKAFPHGPFQRARAAERPGKQPGFPLGKITWPLDESTYFLAGGGISPRNRRLGEDEKRYSRETSGGWTNAKHKKGSGGRSETKGGTALLNRWVKLASSFLGLGG